MTTKTNARRKLTKTRKIKIKVRKKNDDDDVFEIENVLYIYHAEAA